MVTNIMEHLAAVGLSVAVIDGDRLSVSPRERLTDELRDLIRAQREVIVAALKPIEPTSDPATWRELHAAYLEHHWTCKTCIAGSQGRGLRCGAGAALWTGYAKTAIGGGTS